MRLAEELKDRDLQATLRCVRAPCPRRARRVGRRGGVLSAHRSRSFARSAAPTMPPSRSPASRESPSRAATSKARWRRRRNRRALRRRGLDRRHRGSDLDLSDLPRCTRRSGLAACRGVLDHCPPAPQGTRCAARRRGAGIVSRQRTHQSRRRRRLGGGTRSVGLTCRLSACGSLEDACGSPLWVASPRSRPEEAATGRPPALARSCERLDRE